VECVVEIAILGDIYRREYDSQIAAEIAWIAEIAAEIAICESLTAIGIEVEDGVVD